MNQRYIDWLTQLTALPTVAGREDRVVEWVTQWVGRRKHLVMQCDKLGNITIKRKNDRSRKPIYLTGHLDHPAFVVREQVDAKSVVAEFRGGVKDEYFEGTSVTWHSQAGETCRGRVRGFLDDHESGKRPQVVTIDFRRKVSASAGDVITWDVGKPKIKRGHLHTPICDDLAAVVAAFAAMDRLSKLKSAPNVRLFLTRAEEVGFIGAIGACKLGTLPADSTLICLENSKALPEAPIGEGPIIRVGDRISTFGSDLNYQIVRIADEIAKRDKTFTYQRKLMSGGACEATAFQNFGYNATCLCLPLGNYHNMNEQSGRIEPEYISLSDFEGLVTLLVGVGKQLNTGNDGPSLREKLDKLYDDWSHVVSGSQTR